MTTLSVALAALMASIVSVVEMVRQRRLDARPILVVIEKRQKSDNPKSPLVLYLVNMGNAVAMDIRAELATDQRGALQPVEVQYGVAAGRRAEMIQGYPERCIDRVRIQASYKDLNDEWYAVDYNAYDPQQRHIIGKRAPTREKALEALRSRRNPP